MYAARIHQLEEDLQRSLSSAKDGGHKCFGIILEYISNNTFGLFNGLLFYVYYNNRQSRGEPSEYSQYWQTSMHRFPTR